ncbi:kinase-like domain-containing protein [Tirmania nivea]|nr:kinase-like domain-containing protein [Tirmania nivea]
MEYEEEATQPCTQPLGTTKGNSDDTTGILCVLFPTSPTARAIVTRLLHLNQNFVFAQNAAAPLATNISAVTTSDEQLVGLEPTSHLDPQTLSIALRFPPGPMDIAKGFCFGRNEQRCDILMGDNQSTRRVSNIHFRIFVNEQHILMLEDCSTNGTYVDDIFLGPVTHSGHGKKPERLRPRSRQLGNGTQIQVLKVPEKEEIKFMVRIPKADGNGFIGDGEDFSAFDPNNLPHVTATAGASAYFAYIRLPEKNRRLGDGDKACPPSGQLAITQPRPWAGSNKFHLMDQIGHGSFATVQKAVRRINGEPVAIKILNRRTVLKTPDRSMSYKKEVEILEQLKHPNIVQYHECLEDDTHIYIVMEFIGGGDLNDYINKHGKMEEDLVQEVTRQILRGIMYVHERGISHRDIKPDNILLVSEDPIEVKISDFGLAKMVRDEDTFLKTFCGTILYLAPEVYPRYHMAIAPPVTGSKRKHGAIEEKPKREHRYNQAVDMWSIGVVIFVLLTGKPPFEAKNQDEVYERIMTGNFGVEVLRKAGIQNQKCIDFLSRLIEVNPELRIREQDALRHPWLAQGESDSFFSSSMEVDDDLAMHYQRIAQKCSSASDDGDGSWQEVVANSEGEEGEENVDRRRKRESLEWSEGDDGALDAAMGATQIKRLLNYNDPNSQDRGDFNTGSKEEDGLSFDFEPHDTEGISMLHSNGAGLLAFAQNSAHGNPSILPFQEFVSEGSIFSARTMTPHTAQVVSSQPKDVVADAPPNTLDNETQNANIPSSSPHSLAAIKLGTTTPVTLSPQGKIVTPKSKILSPKTPVKSTRADLGQTPTPPLNFLSKLMSESMVSTSSHGLAETTILSSVNSSMAMPQPGRTASQVQMPPPRAPTAPRGPPPYTPRKAILVKATQEGILDWTNYDDQVTTPCWGKLVPLGNSLGHPTILCQRDELIFGRVPKCTIIYTDDRISKKHCSISFMVPSPIPEGAPPPRPRAYLKCTSVNLRVNNKKVEKKIAKVFHGDEGTSFF